MRNLSSGALPIGPPKRLHAPAVRPALRGGTPYFYLRSWFPPKRHTLVEMVDKNAPRSTGGVLFFAGIINCESPRLS